ncbi:MAG: UPF0175 family protein [Pyrinomonadaceae bacterium]
MNVQVKIPDEVFNQTNADTPRRILEAFALEGYESGQLTTAQVRRILGFETRLEVYDFLAKNGVAWVDYSIENAERERNLLRKLVP